MNLKKKTLAVLGELEERNGCTARSHARANMLLHAIAGLLRSAALLRRPGEEAQEAVLVHLTVRAPSWLSGEQAQE